jgi:hypothetical protein
LQTERASEANSARAKHGHTRVNERGGRATTPEYRSFKAMKERCNNSNAPNYHLYGGRGITVCARWSGADGFNNFLGDMGTRPDNTTLDRINNDLGYDPENCRWSSPKVQSANRRNSEEYDAVRRRNLALGRERMWSDQEIRERLLESRRRKSKSK